MKRPEPATPQPTPARSKPLSVPAGRVPVTSTVLRTVSFKGTPSEGCAQRTGDRGRGRGLVRRTTGAEFRVDRSGVDEADKGRGERTWKGNLTRGPRTSEACYSPAEATLTARVAQSSFDRGALRGFVRRHVLPHPATCIECEKRISSRPTILAPRPAAPRLQRVPIAEKL